MQRRGRGLVLDHAGLGRPALFAGVALFSTLGLTLITQGFRIGPASVVAPFDYTGLLWATLLGWLFWHETPDLLDCVGAAFIASSGLYIAWRATSRRRSWAPPAIPAAGRNGAAAPAPRWTPRPRGGPPPPAWDRRSETMAAPAASAS